MDKIEKYRKTLGANAPRGFRHGTLAKIKWAQHVQEQSSKLKDDIDMKMGHVRFVLSLLHYRSDREYPRSISAAIVNHTATTSHLGDQVAAIGDDFKQCIQLAHVEKITGLRNLGKEIGKNSTAIKDFVVAESQLARDTIATENSAISLSIEETLARYDNASTTTLEQIRSKMATSEDMYQILSLLSSNQSVSAHKPSTSSSHQEDSHVTLALTIPTIQVTARTIRDLLQQNCLYGDDLTIAVAVGAVVLTMREFILALPYMLFVAYLLDKIPLSMSTILCDNFTLNDALGRTRRLQFLEFRHWPVFEASLRHHFTDSPSSQKVVEGRFVLTTPSQPGVWLSAINWSQVVRRCMVVVMSISMTTIIAESGSCPRECGTRTAPWSTFESRCLDCDLLFSTTYMSDYQRLHHWFQHASAAYEHTS